MLDTTRYCNFSVIFVSGVQTREGHNFGLGCAKDTAGMFLIYVLKTINQTIVLRNHGSILEQRTISP